MVWLIVRLNIYKELGLIRGLVIGARVVVVLRMLVERAEIYLEPFVSLQEHFCARSFLKSSHSLGLLSDSNMEGLRRFRHALLKLF